MSANGTTLRVALQQRFPKTMALLEKVRASHEKIDMIHRRELLKTEALKVPPSEEDPDPEADWKIQSGANEVSIAHLHPFRSPPYCAYCLVLTSNEVANLTRVPPFAPFPQDVTLISTPTGDIPALKAPPSKEIDYLVLIPTGLPKLAPLPKTIVSSQETVVATPLPKLTTHAKARAILKNAATRVVRATRDSAKSLRIKRTTVKTQAPTPATAPPTATPTRKLRGLHLLRKLAPIKSKAVNKALPLEPRVTLTIIPNGDNTAVKVTLLVPAALDLPTSAALKPTAVKAKVLVKRAVRKAVKATKALRIQREIKTSSAPAPAVPATQTEEPTAPAAAAPAAAKVAAPKWRAAFGRLTQCFSRHAVVA